MLSNISTMADIVVIGGGPVGLWSAIQLKKRLPGAGVLVYERHEAYQRSHVLRLDHWSLILYAKVSRDQAETEFLADVTGHSLAGMRTRLAKSLYIRTNDFEAALSRYAQALGIEKRILRVDSPEHARALHPECRLFVAADGSHSALRTALFGSDALQTTPLQHVLELKCEEQLSPEQERAPRLDTAELWQLNRSLGHTATEYVGRARGGKAPATLRVFLDAEEYAQLPEMSFKNPFLLGQPGLPASVEQDLRAWLAARADRGTHLVEGSARLSKLVLSMYASKRFATMHNDCAWFLVGDAAMGVPYLRALNSGLMMTSRLAQIVAKTNYPHEGVLERKVLAYDTVYRPMHVATEFAIARGKDLALDAFHTVRDWFSVDADGRSDA